MRYLSKKQAMEFFKEIVGNEYGSFDLELNGGETVMINGHVVRDWRSHTRHGVLWYNVETDSWSVMNLSPEAYWAIMEEGMIVKFVNSLDYAMHRCGFGG